ncbi:unnamed protein product [Closterium sp. NIES-64]|nr:unnamed protein product [Closterium sp. NIES-64]
MWETESWTCQQWSVGAQQITAAAWSPDSRVLLLAFHSTPTLAAVHIARSPPALDIHVLPLELPDLASLMIDPMSPPELSTFGGVTDMAWDATGRRLALSFSSARMDTAGLVALFDTHLAPILTASLLGVIRGPSTAAPPPPPPQPVASSSSSPPPPPPSPPVTREGEQPVAPLAMSFRPNFKHGALLSVLWSSGLCRTYPMLFTGF